MTVGTNVVAGFTAIAVTLRTLRFREAMGPVDEPPASTDP